MVETELKKPIAKQLLVKNTYVGINASDINYSAGRYDPTLKPPHDCGFESIGIVEEVGEGARTKKGQPVIFFGTPARAFSEYIVRCLLLVSCLISCLSDSTRVTRN